MSAKNSISSEQRQQVQEQRVKKLSAIKEIADEFLRFVWDLKKKGEVISEGEYYARIGQRERLRHERIVDLVDSCNVGFDSLDVLLLFEELEGRAFQEIRKLTALAQTTEPNALEKHGIPSALIEAVSNLHEYNKGSAPRKAREYTMASKNKREFLEWAEEEHVKKANPKNSSEIKAINGFCDEWCSSPSIINAWWREVRPDYAPSTGRGRKTEQTKK